MKWTRLQWSSSLRSSQQQRARGMRQLHLSTQCNSCYGMVHRAQYQRYAEVNMKKWVMRWPEAALSDPMRLRTCPEDVLVTCMGPRHHLLHMLDAQGPRNDHGDLRNTRSEAMNQHCATLWQQPRNERAILFLPAQPPCLPVFLSAITACLP